MKSKKKNIVTFQDIANWNYDFQYIFLKNSSQAKHMSNEPIPHFLPDFRQLSALALLHYNKLAASSEINLNNGDVDDDLLSFQTDNVEAYQGRMPTVIDDTYYDLYVFRNFA